MSMLFKIILLQLIAASVVVFVLKLILEHELLVYALEHIEGYKFADGEDVKEVTVIVAHPLADKMLSRVTAVFKTKFPDAQVSIIVSRDIGGGLVTELSGKVLDYSLAGRLKHLWGQGNE